MQKLGASLRSKMPLFQFNRAPSATTNEETFLLNSFSNKNYTGNSNYSNITDDDYDNESYQDAPHNYGSASAAAAASSPKQVDGFEGVGSGVGGGHFKFDRDTTDTDLHSMSGKSYSNRIDEWQAGWNVTNAIQGMFVVSLPYAIANGGYWALLAMLLAAYVCCYTGKILVDCLYDDDDDELVDLFKSKPFSLALKVSASRRRHRIRTSYVDIAKDVWGSRFGARLVNLAQNIELLMTCILYLVLCGDLFVGSFPQAPLDHSAWTMISCMMLLPCAFIKSLRFVSRLSFCNAIVHLIINVIILFYCFTQFGSWDFSKVEIKINPWSFPISLGIIVFSYTSQIFLPTLEGSMVDRAKFDSMLNVSHLCAAIFKGFFGYVGFLTWQEDTDEVITNNLPTRQLKILVNMILVVKALLSYPLPYFASVELLESSLFMVGSTSSDGGGGEFGGFGEQPTAAAATSANPNHQQPRRRFKSSSSAAALNNQPIFMFTCYDVDGDLKFWAVCLRILLIIFTLFLAIFIPHFAILMGLIGSITGTMLSLIWPCYFHLHLKRKSLKWYQIAVDVVIIVFGLVITVTGIYYSSVALIKALRQGSKLNYTYYKNNNYFVNKNAADLFFANKSDAAYFQKDEASAARSSSLFFSFKNFSLLNNP
jgi:vesicular inhibitory amino acid transporter